MPEAPLFIDRLPAGSPGIEVKFTDCRSFGSAADGARKPHRHDYHELSWTRRGSGSHLIDGRRYPITPGTLSLVGRGQIHVLERGSDIAGAVVRFTDELLVDDFVGRVDAGWLRDSLAARTVLVPAADIPRFEALLEALAVETRRTHGYRARDVQRHLLSTVLVWVERWYQAMPSDSPAPDVDHRLYGRFLGILDRDFVRHHDTGHYADTLAVPGAALSRTLMRVCGRTTKELITDRVMLEAARLLRFTDLSIGEVAFRCGFADQFYFSRAFKRRYGAAPLAYRTDDRGDRGA